MSDRSFPIEDEIPKLRRYARALVRDRNLADDLVQDTLARALAKAHLWQEGSDLRAWLFTILHNQYVNYVRRGAREGSSVALTDTEMRLTAPAEQQGRLQLRDLQRALDKLSDEQRQVILLIGLEGLSYEAVASIVDVPVGTVRSRLSRGREALRALMDEGTTASPASVDNRAAARVTVAAIRKRGSELSGSMMAAL